MIKIVLAVAIALFVSLPAFAENIFNARVTNVSDDIVPEGVYFILDQGAGNCPAGIWFYYDGYPRFQYGDPRRDDNVFAKFASVLGARFNGYYISVFDVTRYDWYCRIGNLHVGS